MNANCCVRMEERYNNFQHFPVFSLTSVYLVVRYVCVCSTQDSNFNSNVYGEDEA